MLRIRLRNEHCRPIVTIEYPLFDFDPAFVQMTRGSHFVVLAERMMQSGEQDAARLIASGQNHDGDVQYEEPAPTTAPIPCAHISMGESNSR